MCLVGHATPGDCLVLHAPSKEHLVEKLYLVENVKESEVASITLKYGVDCGDVTAEEAIMDATAAVDNATDLAADNSAWGDSTWGDWFGGASSSTTAATDEAKEPDSSEARKKAGQHSSRSSASAGNSNTKKGSLTSSSKNPTSTIISKLTASEWRVERRYAELLVFLA
eukprot:GSA25T00015963001.1